MPDLLNLHDYEHLARERLPPAVYDYYAGGAGDELTVRENEQGWGQVRLRPRVLVDVSACDLRTTILGVPVAMPLLTAPCALNALAHPDGELAVARATATADVVQVLSTLSAYDLEAVATTANGKRWFQLYCYRERALTQSLVERAEAAGYAALCLTVDVPVPSQRERDTRNRFKIPPHIRAANLSHRVTDSADGSALHQYVGNQFDSSLTWESVTWLKTITRLPIVVKGVLTAEDAELAIQHGVAGIVVSNHGGRQLDGVLPTSAALPEVVAAVNGAAEVFVDGGIRRGADILKALALGARAVLLGRPYLWGLAVEGEAGVQQVLAILRAELHTAMALAGCPTLADIRPTLVAPRTTLA